MPTSSRAPPSRAAFVVPFARYQAEALPTTFGLKSGAFALHGVGVDRTGCRAEAHGPEILPDMLIMNRVKGVPPVTGRGLAKKCRPAAWRNAGVGLRAPAARWRWPGAP